MTTPKAADQKGHHKSSIRETLISIVIAFAMAFVFRGFVIEAFLIPTGSMAPTLLGAHMRFEASQTGYSWPMDTRDKVSPGSSEPLPIQGTSSNPIKVHDPMSGQLIDRKGVPVRWGDRIFVMKYLYSVYEPERFDVVVFKNPTDPTVNYIKRLLGLPGEQIALVDGDVFARTPRADDSKDVNPWLLPGWHAAQKPERAQRAMWQDVFSSEFTPLKPDAVQPRFTSPWRAAPGVDPKQWAIAGRADYRYTGPGPTAIEWDSGVREINDSYAYNEVSAPGVARYPVSDIRTRLGVRPENSGAAVSAVLVTRGHEFRADIDGAAVTLRMKRLGGRQLSSDSPGIVDLPAGDWVELGKGSLEQPLPAGRVTNIEFWHADQSLTLFVNDQPVARGSYDWTPDQRLRYAASMSADEAMRSSGSLLSASAAYTHPEVRWVFSGGPLTLYRVGLARDIYYQPAVYHNVEQGRRHSRLDEPANATHPKSTLNLTPEQFFVCGDNSPSSLDARLWDKPNPWVAELDKTIGVVHRDLLIGKAFWVYFPAPGRRQGIPVPDWGRMRFIW
ncbi:Signal peptidase I [Phycisphaerales bacterium]|nr:Signal peptidase I [Phycisphaerales bacterium]